MAQRMNLKPFLLGLGLIAVGGVVAIVLLANGSQGRRTVAVPPITPAADSFAGYVMGSDSAPVEIVEYADFECPACAQFTILTEPDIRARLINSGQVRLRFRDFPLPGHDKSPVAHLAAACAGEQGKFWQMHDQLYYNQGRWARDDRPDRVIRQLASAIGLDMSRYDDCVKSNRYAERINASRDEGVRLGVGFTPTFIIGTQLVPGAAPYAEFAKLVQQAEAARSK